jgi:hypothetical protein
VQVVGDDLVADGDDGVNQIGVRPAGVEEGLQRGRIGMAPIAGDASRQGGQCVELRVPSCAARQY